MSYCTQYKYGVQEDWRALEALAQGPFAWRYARYRRPAEHAARRTLSSLQRLAVAVLDLLGEAVAGPGLERLPDPARHPECWFRLV